MKKRRLIYVLSLCVLLLNIIACKPTYQKDKVIESVQKMCKDTYNLDVEVKIIGETLGAFIILKDLIGPDFLFQQEPSKKMDEVLLSITRVCLSTDAPLKYFVVICRDPDKNINVSFIRYIDDIKKYLISSIARDDYFNRLIMDVKVRDPLADGGFFLPELTLADFLALQIDSRLRAETGKDKISVPNFVVEASKVEGKNDKTYVFNCKLEAKESPEEYMWDEFLELLLEIVYNVCLKYNFSDYEAVKLLEVDGEDIFTLDKNSLKKYSGEKRKWVFK